MKRAFPVPESLIGGQESWNPPRRIAAGGFELRLAGIDLREVRWGSTDLLNRVYVAVRDRNWDTIPTQASTVRVRGSR